jgi:hypothetical protein
LLIVFGTGLLLRTVLLRVLLHILLLLLLLLLLLWGCLTENLLLGLWCWRWNFDHNVGWLSDNFRLEALLWIGCVTNSSDESIGIDDRVTSFDHVAFTLLLTVLVVCELIVFNIEAKLV